MAVAVATRLFHFSDKTIKMLRKPIPGYEHEIWPVATETSHAMAVALTPGPSSAILLMNARALARIAQSLYEVKEAGSVVDMLRWITDIFTVATSVGMYGPDSPLTKDISLVRHIE